MNRRLAAGLCALALGAGALSLGTGAPAYAKEGEVDCSGVELGHEPPYYETSEASPVLAEMGVGEAHEWLRAHGRKLGDVGVAVVDSGVSTAQGKIRVSDSTGGNATYYHGTAVAGLIAGTPRGDEPTGIAPDAHIVDAHFYDDPDGGGSKLTNDNLAGALEWLLGRSDSFDIVNISVRLGPDPRVESLIRQLTDRGKIVVAAAGNRDEDDPEYNGAEDAAEQVFPAGYDGVVAAGAQIQESGSEGNDASGSVLANSATAVSAPTTDAVSYGVTGESCVLMDGTSSPATSWAAAEVSGVLALLRSAYPQDTAAQLVSRLELTASGRVDVPGTFTGAGMVQPTEALTRPLELGKDGRVDFSEQVVQAQSPVLPATEDDVLAAAKKSAVWWGIIGGGALLVAVLLRPLFARRR